jgi:F-type H+-transporting ATPase subunit b
MTAETTHLPTSVAVAAEETHATTEVAHETAAAPTGLASLGINLPLFVAQLVNVAIILVVLRMWVFKPLAKVLEDRRKKIEDGLKNAKEADDKLKHAQEKQDEMMSEARKEARQIIDDAKSKGEAERAKQVEQTKRDMDAQVEEAKSKIVAERAAALETVRKEVAGLVVAATKKVSMVELDEKAHKSAVDQAIKELDA